MNFLPIGCCDLYDLEATRQSTADNEESKKWPRPRPGRSARWLRVYLSTPPPSPAEAVDRLLTWLKNLREGGDNVASASSALAVAIDRQGDPT